MSTKLPIDPATVAPGDGLRDAFISRFADAIGGRASARTVFGDPVERDGVTVIPVGKVRWGFGGGSGAKTGEEGSGGGGGAAISPLGFIQISGGKAEFKRVLDLGAVTGLVIASALSAVVVMKTIRGLFRR